MKNTLQPKEKKCHFCVNQIEEIDYKDTQLLRRFTSMYAKILPRRRTGVCAKHQRVLCVAIKRSRIMGLLPFIAK